MAATVPYFVGDSGDIEILSNICPGKSLDGMNDALKDKEVSKQDEDVEVESLAVSPATIYTDTTGQTTSESKMLYQDPLMIFAFIFLIGMSYLFTLIFARVDITDSGDGDCDGNYKAIDLHLNNTSLVTYTLSTYCKCVPAWMEEDVYFEPLSTLMIAVLAVVAYVCLNRLGPVVQSFIASLFKQTSPRLTKRFLILPEHIQLKVESSLKCIFPDIPDILIPDVSSSDDVLFADWLIPKLESLRKNVCDDLKDDIKLSSLSEENVKSITEKLSKEFNIIVVKLRNRDKTTSLFSENQRFCADNSPKENGKISTGSALGKKRSKTVSMTNEAMVEAGVNPAFIQWRDENQDEFTPEFQKAIFSSQSKLCEETEQQDASVILLLQIALGIWVLIDYFGVQVWPSGSSWHCRWAYFTAVVMYKPFTVPMWVCLTMCCHYTFTDKLFRDKFRDEKTGTPYGAPFIRSKLTILMLVIVTLLLVIWLLVAASISLPLIMIFSPLVIVYSFIIPFLSLWIPQKLIGWFKKKIVPFLSSWSLRFIDRLTIIFIFIRSDEEKEEKEEEIKSANASSKKMAKNPQPESIEETVFALKASTTQLVSVLVISFIFLPFYADGFFGWDKYVREFLNLNLNVPRIQLMFRYTFEWPDFEQPRLSVQLAFGVIITLIQVLFRVCKRFMLTYKWALLMPLEKDEHNDVKMILRAERIVKIVFLQSSWSLFRKIGSVTHASLDTTVVFNKKAFHDIYLLYFEGVDKDKGYQFDFLFLYSFNQRGYKLINYSGERSKEYHLMRYAMAAHVLFIPFVILIMFIYYWFKFLSSSACITFTKATTDDEVVDFADSEDTMVYGTFTVTPDCEVDVDTICYLLMKCPWIKNLEVNGSENPLIWAAKKRSFEIVRLLIERGADVNAEDEKNDGYTTLYIASQWNHPEVIKLLIKAGADVDKANYYGNTPLYFASWNNHFEVVELLINAGADVNKEGSNDYQTPLFTASENNHPEVVHLLIDAGADVMKTRDDGYTPLHIAASSKRRLEVVKLLIKAGADVNIGNKNGETPLFCASENNHPEVVKVLIKAGAYVDKANIHGQTPLSMVDEESEVEKLLRAAVTVQI